MELWSWIVLGLLSAFTIIGNGGVITLITTRRRLRNTANWFVLSLAVADFIFGAFYQPLLKLGEVYDNDSDTNHSDTNDSYNNEDDTNDSISICIEVLAAASITNLCVMTLDRYIAIVHPLRYVTFMRPRRVGLLISAAWVMALIRPSFNLEEITAVPGAVSKTLMILDTVLYQVIPGTALLLATVHILLIVRRHSKQTAALEAQLRHNYPLRSPQERTESRSQNPSTQTREAISAKVVVVVVVVFIFYLTLRVLQKWLDEEEDDDDDKDDKLLNVVRVFMILNSAVNPFAYAFFKTDIRREIRTCFCCSKENQ